jgi:carbon-monoxide dehydrogenase medium subunit
MLCQFYFKPKTIWEALDILKKFKGEARILAGGTDLMIDLKTQKRKVKALVDISQIEGLDKIREDDVNLYIGAMVTHTQASKSDLIIRRAVVLSEACSAIGSPQIRNMGTLVGNIVNAQPAADAALALMALGTRAKIVNWDNKEHTIPIEQLYKGPGESIVDSAREIVIELEFPLPDSHTSSAFQRLSRRKALSLPILNVAVFVRLNEGLKIFKEAHIVLGPVSPLPFRSKIAENFLMGSFVTAEVIEQTGLASSDEASPRASLRGGKEYRKEMVKVLVERGIRQALIRIHPKFSSL